MLHPAVVAIACLPLIFRLIPMVVPSKYLESYRWWSADELNRDADGVVQSQWRNMGYWAGTDSFPEAGEALARRLLDLADAPAEGNILDIAHGGGESLILHLKSPSPPRHLHALTSLTHESEQAQRLLHNTSYPPSQPSTTFKWFVSSASYRPGKDFDHPLNPMRRHLGRLPSSPDLPANDSATYLDCTADGCEEVPDEELDKRAIEAPPPYDLVYILDSIYHFPPSVPHFLSAVLPVLRQGSGVVAYTDILPPADLNNALGHLVLPPLVGVPARNLVSRPKDLDEYKALLERIGFVDVVIEDWSASVFPGFAAFLGKKGLPWSWVGKGAEWADSSGWKFVGVRARRPETVIADDQF